GGSFALPRAGYTLHAIPVVKHVQRPRRPMKFPMVGLAERCTLVTQSAHHDHALRAVRKCKHDDGRLIALAIWLSLRIQRIALHQYAELAVNRRDVAIEPFAYIQKMRSNVRD